MKSFPFYNIRARDADGVLSFRFMGIASMDALLILTSGEERGKIT